MWSLLRLAIRLDRRAAVCGPETNPVVSFFVMLPALLQFTFGILAVYPVRVWFFFALSAAFIANGLVILFLESTVPFRTRGGYLCDENKGAIISQESADAWLAACYFFFFYAHRARTLLTSERKTHTHTHIPFPEYSLFSYASLSICAFLLAFFSAWAQVYTQQVALEGCVIGASAGAGVASIISYISYMHILPRFHYAHVQGALNFLGLSKQVAFVPTI